MRVGFFARLPFHRAILAPVHDAVGARAERVFTADRGQVAAFAPDVIVMASHAELEYFRTHVPRAYAVNVRHGMIGKRLISRLPARASARAFDFVCVGHQQSLAGYEQGGARPREYWHTGYPQVDPLFRRDPPPPLPLAPGRPTVLYAPTWNLGLTSAAMLGARVVDLIRAGAPGANVVIKPHPVLGEWRPRWVARWARLAARERGVLLVDDTHADVVPYMLASDVLVSDASSVIFEFLALDRPIVLVTNPRHRADPAYAPDDIVWRWRDVGDEVHEAGDLGCAVASALAMPSRRAERRRAYAQLLFGPFTDGENHVRVAEKILALEGAPPRTPPPGPLPSMSERIWYELRARVSMSPAWRRLILGPLESVRLRARSRAGRGRDARRGGVRRLSE
jgi:CDP-glycerol glycerophosphotransferase (TagB/SpsB family)